MKLFSARNFAYVLTITLGLIGGTSGAGIPPGISMLDLQPRLLATPLPDPLCYPGYNNMPQTWDWNKVQPVIRDFKALIESDAEIYMGFTQMFQQIPNATRYQNDTANIGPLIRDYDHMLYRFNRSLEWSPPFGVGAAAGDTYALPMTILLYWPACTEAGYRMFVDDKVNDFFKRILNTWAKFLNTSRSLCSLSADVGGWFSQPALDAMQKASGSPFADLYACNASAPHYGFTTWDSFFTRQFRNRTRDRPVYEPSNNSIITNPCESTPFNISYNIKDLDTFWIKGERYSVRFILNNDTLAHQFVGGTVYQSYLAGMDYHRWHSPVDGKIAKIVTVPGTYFAFSTAFGFDQDPKPDPDGQGWSEIYMSNVATRMLIFIEADNKDIGMMVFVAIGMGEVSSCEAKVTVGQAVKKGDPLGTFHFGGSSFAMLFRNGTNIKFYPDAEPNPNNPTRLYLNKGIGQVQ